MGDWATIRDGLGTSHNSWSAVRVDGWLGMSIDGWLGMSIDSWSAMRVDSWLSVGIDSWLSVLVDGGLLSVDSWLGGISDSLGGQSRGIDIVGDTGVTLADAGVWSVHGLGEMRYGSAEGADGALLLGANGVSVM